MRSGIIESRRILTAVTLLSIATSSKVAALAPTTPTPNHPLDCTGHANALVCHKFNEGRDIEQAWIDPGTSCVPKASYDEIEHAGRLTIGTRCGANSSGDFRFDFPRQEGQLWLRFRFKQEQALIDDAASFKLPSPKVFVMWAGRSSCSAHEFAQVNSYWRGYLQFYERCGAAPSVVNLPPSDYDTQPGGDTRCHYQPPTERPDKKCVFYREKWATHTFHLDLDGAKHQGVPWVDGWVQYDDERRYHVLSIPLRHTRRINSVYFGPYMTSKSRLIDHPQWNVWYQDILVTREPLIHE